MAGPAYSRLDVGQVECQETAEIAIEAALTGHLLVSTLHTNDAPSTVARMTEMEVEPFMISASLVCVCAQRLMRRVCKNCKQPYMPEGREKENHPVCFAATPPCGGARRGVVTSKTTPSLRYTP